MSAQPGIFFVNSKITSATLSPEVFNRWYQDIHIPDILATSGIKATYRYLSTTPDRAERPYLAVYPVRDVGWVRSDEFRSIPVHSDMLPNESKAIFEIADFDSRVYILLGKKGGESIHGPSDHIVTVAFDALTDDLDTLYAESLAGGLAPIRSRMLKLDFLLGHTTIDGEREMPRYLVLHEFNSAPDIGALRAKPGVTVALFNLLGASGNVNAEFEDR